LYIDFVPLSQIALQYILEYPLGKLLNKHLEYYVTQLSYEMEMGRESALEMLATVFSAFPQVQNHEIKIDHFQ
jgi:U3 small nucleolar RNA-associated protein 20